MSKLEERLWDIVDRDGAPRQVERLLDLVAAERAAEREAIAADLDALGSATAAGPWRSIPLALAKRVRLGPIDPDEVHSCASPVVQTSEDPT